MNAPSNRERADRFQGNRSYIHNPGNVEWWRGALALAALLGGVYSLWHFWLSPSARGNGFYSSRGEVNIKHSAWNDRCDACHTPYAILEGKAHELLNINARWNEFTCRHCHDGPSHHTYKNDADQNLDNYCATCHHDHQGRNSSLIFISDSHCTTCHNELKAHPPKSGESVYAPQIANFYDKGGHPEFRAVEKGVERTLKFSHARHMVPGMVLNRGQKPYSLKDIQDTGDKRYYDKYNKEEFLVPGTNTVQLTCYACHELDSNRKSNEDWQGEDKFVPEMPRETLQLPRGNGEYFRPVNYEKACQGCHPLDVNLKSKEFDVKETLSLPHRKQPKEFEKYFQEYYTNKIVRGEELKNADPLPKRLDPPELELSPKKEGEIKLMVEKAMKLVKDTPALCTKCHETDKSASKDDKEVWSIVPPKIPTVWLEHARFSHVGHRAMNCSDCHPGKGFTFNEKDELNRADPIKGEPLGIPGVDFCRRCHAPATEKNGVRLGGVRHDCTDCHRYHNAEFPLQGMGAKRRDPNIKPEDRFQTGTLLDGVDPEIKKKMSGSK